MKNYLRAGCALCLILCASAAYMSWRPNSLPVAKAKKESGQQRMDEEVEAKAKRARFGDEASIRELAEAVIATYAVGLPPEAVDRLKDRLVRAELKHRRGKKGIRELNVVKAVNQLAENFGAPEYARTSPLQVRVMRAGLKNELPSLISPEEGPEDKPKKIGHRLKDDLSPLEAVTVTAMLIHQKMLNPDWQVSPGEFAAQARAKKQKPNAGGAESGPHKARLGGDDRDRRKSREMMETVGRKAGRLSRASVLELLDSSIDTLGIER